jgi:hypothetical protein
MCPPFTAAESQLRVPLHRARPAGPGEGTEADRAGRACCVARDPRTNNAFEGEFRDILKERGTEAPTNS